MVSCQTSNFNVIALLSKLNYGFVILFLPELEGTSRPKPRTPPKIEGKKQVVVHGFL